MHPPSAHTDVIADVLRQQLDKSIAKSAFGSPCQHEANGW